MKKIKQELDNFSDTLKNISFLLIFLANFCIIFIKLSRRFCRRFFLAPPNVGGAFLLPKGNNYEKVTYRHFRHNMHERKILHCRV